MKLTFETATFADVMKKVAAIAPAKAGEAFDKAAGIHISVVNSQVQVRATNLKIFYLEVVDAVNIEGRREDGPFEWRLSSMTLPAIMSQLPIGTGRTVTLEQVEEKVVALTSGRTTAKLRMMDASYYPPWEPFDPEGLESVPNLGARIQQVEWAADTSGEPPLSSIHLTGEQIISTDRYRLAAVPCKVPINKPITVPSGIFLPMTQQLRSDVSMGLGDNQLYLMPDEHTQIRAAIFAVQYPNISKGMIRTHPDKITFNKSDVLRMIKLAMIFGTKERIPKLTVFLGQEEIAVMMSDAEEGLLGDVLDLPGQCQHKRIKLFFTPKNLLEAITASPSEEVVLHYDTEKTNRQVRIDGGSGYEAWVMPRTVKEE